MALHMQCGAGNNIYTYNKEKVHTNVCHLNQIFYFLLLGMQKKTFQRQALRDYFLINGTNADK